MRKLYQLLFLAGTLLLVGPWVLVEFNEWKQDRLLQKMEQALSESPSSAQPQTLKAEFEQLSQLFEQTAAAAIQENPDVDAIEEHQPEVSIDPTPSPAPASSPAIAIIEIDKINVKLPVLEGATQANMKHAAAHMKETTVIGEVGNAAIAAHRARKKGRLFNRLDELEAGDQIVVRTGDKEFVYTVFKVSLVEPTDISVLGMNDKDAVLTLITCDPVVNPTHRLIVHAKL